MSLLATGPKQRPRLDMDDTTKIGIPTFQVRNPVRIHWAVQTMVIYLWDASICIDEKNKKSTEVLNRALDKCSATAMVKYGADSLSAGSFQAIKRLLRRYLDHDLHSPELRVGASSQRHLVHQNFRFCPSCTKTVSIRLREISAHAIQLWRWNDAMTPRLILCPASNFWSFQWSS